MIVAVGGRPTCTAMHTRLSGRFHSYHVAVPELCVVIAVVALLIDIDTTRQGRTWASQWLYCIVQRSLV